MERKRTASVRRAAATAVLLSAVAVLAVVAFAAMPAAEAEGGDASVTSVATYEELKNALGAGGNIKINKDIVVKPTLEVSGSAVIDLNGNTLAGVDCTVFDVKGTLTLKGNGAIKCINFTNVEVIKVASNGADSSKGSLNIEGSVTIGSGQAIKLIGSSKVYIHTQCLLTADVIFSGADQKLVLDSDARYDGVISKAGEAGSMDFGGYIEGETRTSDYIVAGTTCVISYASTAFEISGTFKGEDKDKSRPIFFTGCSVKFKPSEYGTGFGQGVLLTVSDDASFTIGSDCSFGSESKMSVKGKVTVEEGVCFNNFGYLEIDGSLNVHGEVNNYSSLITNSKGSLTIEDRGRISSSAFQQYKPSIKNSGSITNRGNLSLGDGNSFYPDFDSCSL